MDDMDERDFTIFAFKMCFRRISSPFSPSPVAEQDKTAVLKHLSSLVRDCQVYLRRKKIIVKYC